jgi:hypothetical protein
MRLTSGKPRATSLRIAFAFVVFVVILFVVAFVFFFVWLFSKEDIGSE